MKKIFLLCMILSFTTLHSKAEEYANYWRLKAGVNFSNFTNLDYSSKFQTGFNLGILHSRSISQQLPLYLQSGISFEMKGAKNSGYGITTTTFKSYALEAPILLNYEVKISKKSTILPFVGLYYSVALSGKLEAGDESINPYKKEDVVIDPVEGVISSRMFSRSDFGIRAGVDYKYSSYSIGIAYDAGLTNIYAKDFRDANFKASSGSISINLGYFF